MRLSQILSFLLLATASFARRHRHTGPIGNETCFLYGKISSTAFKVELKKDVIIWDELERDGSTFESCQNKPNGIVNITISGPNLDTSDYTKGTAFVIDLEDWEAHCGKPEKVQGISPSDPVLFFNIVHSRANPYNARTVSIRLQRIPGSSVSPSVEVAKLSEQHPAIRQFKELHIDTENFLNHKSAQISAIYSLGDSTAIGNSDVSEFSIFPGAIVDTRAEIDASIGSLRFKRLFNLEVEWQQALRVNVSSILISSSKYRASDVKRILRRDLPGLSLRARVPFLGTISAKAYNNVNLVQSISVDENLFASVESTHENMLRVSAKFSSGALTVESLLPPGFGSSGTGTVDFGDVVRHEFGMTGFYGYEIGLGVIVQLGVGTIDALADVTIGQESSLNRQFPPFPPLVQGGTANGACSTCHALRIVSGVVGKNLRTRIFENGRLTDENLHIRDLFSYELSSVCAEEASC